VGLEHTVSVLRVPQSFQGIPPKVLQIVLLCMHLMILYLFIEYLLMSLDVAPIATILLPQSPLRTEALL
jgi:hypothetical protein